jgi:hypothetical protein
MAPCTCTGNSEGGVGLIISAEASRTLRLWRDRSSIVGRAWLLEEDFILLTVIVVFVVGLWKGKYR